MGRYGMNNTGYLTKILSIVCSVFDAYSAILFLPGKTGDDHRIAAVFSLGDEVLGDTVIKEGKGMVGWIIRNNRPLLINNFDRKRSRLGYYPQAEESRIKAFLGCPLGGGLGALCLDSKRTYSFSEKDQKILQLFAELILELLDELAEAKESMADFRYYQALRNIQGLRRQFTRWPEFQEKFLEIMSQATGFEYCFLMVLDEDSDSFFLEGSSAPLLNARQESMAFSLKSGLVGWVFNNNQPVFTGEKEMSGAISSLLGKEVHTPGFKSIMCLPLFYQRAVRGVLGLAHEESVEITDSLRSFSESAADHLALFLENLYLRLRLRQAETPQ